MPREGRGAIGDNEWLVADGLGGYAMGRADGIRSRRYHGLLLVASPRTEQRFMLVNGVEAWVEMGERRIALTSHHYAPDVIHPDGQSRSRFIGAEPWPSWTFDLGGAELTHEVSGVRDRAVTLLRWRYVGKHPARLRARPLMSGRDWHALHQENPAFGFQPERRSDNTWQWSLYEGLPRVIAHCTGDYAHDPEWFRRFLYVDEQARGLDCIEDLASPGVFTFELDPSKTAVAELILTTSEDWNGVERAPHVTVPGRTMRESERARIAAHATRTSHSAEAYLVKRGERRTIIAGYPWFTDWGRDTFISLPGLCFTTGRWRDALEILLSWCDALSEGMMPNYFPSGGSEPEFNSVDASLWFIAAVQRLLVSVAAHPDDLPQRERARLIDTCHEILRSYERGTRYNIGMDFDALLFAGAPGRALTWMDAIVDGRPVTPRIGKPVEVQALWINALRFGSTWDQLWETLADRAATSFDAQFWNAREQCLYDVVDADRRPDAVDPSVRPNQVLACGGLPSRVVSAERAKQILAKLESELWTPFGLRTLSPSDPAYVGKADGDMRTRDAAYHQGTVWPWLTFPFLEAWVRAQSKPPAAIWRHAQRKFLPGLLRHLDQAGIGHVSEIFDGDAPHEPRGCPFQAWSLAALLDCLTPR